MLSGGALSCHCPRNLLTSRWWSTLRVSHTSMTWQGVQYKQTAAGMPPIKGQKNDWGSQEKGFMRLMKKIMHQGIHGT